MIAFGNHIDVAFSSSVLLHLVKGELDTLDKLKECKQAVMRHSRKFPRKKFLSFVLRIGHFHAFYTLLLSSSHRPPPLKINRVSYKREFLKSYQICEELNRDDISWYTKHQLIQIKVFLTWLFDKKKEVRLMSVLMCPQAQKIWQNVKMYFLFSPLGYLWWSRSLVWFIIFSHKGRDNTISCSKSPWGCCFCYITALGTTAWIGNPIFAAKIKQRVPHMVEQLCISRHETRL